MRVYLLNRSAVCVFCGEKLLPVHKEGAKEYVEADVREGEWLTLRFFRCSELSSRLWPLYALFFWVIGLFGLFTPRYAKFSHRLDCTAHIAAGARPPVLRFTHYLGSAEKPIPAVTPLEGCYAQIENGFYVRDDAANRRRKLYKVCSWLLRIVCVAAIVVLLIKLIVN